MSDKNETIADIVADIRMQNQGLPEDSNALSPLVCDLLNLANRIEAAAKRMEVMHNREMEHYKQERNEAPAKERKRLRDNGFMIIRKEDSVGNAAKLREAVKQVLDAVKHLSRIHNDDLPEDVRAVLGGIAFYANASLAAPARNCDLYADEQSAWEAFSNARQGADSSTEEYEKWLFEKAEVKHE